LLLSSLTRRLFITFFRFFRFGAILERMSLMQRSEVHVWEQVIAEISRWTILILFLIPTLEAWGLSRATLVLNQLLFYIPNLIIAILILFIGIVSSNLIADVVKQSTKSIGNGSAQTLIITSRAGVIFFTSLIVLNQLGVAQDLIRILFTGIVAMVAIAGGLAFGLGGKDHAKDILEYIKKSLRQREKSE
jgi:hypothetical protein